MPVQPSSKRLVLDDVLRHVGHLCPACTLAGAPAVVQRRLQLQACTLDERRGIKPAAGCSALRRRVRELRLEVTCQRHIARRRVIGDVGGDRLVAQAGRIQRQRQRGGGDGFDSLSVMRLASLLDDQLGMQRAGGLDRAQDGNDVARAGLQSRQRLHQVRDGVVRGRRSPAAFCSSTSTARVGDDRRAHARPPPADDQRLRTRCSG